MPNIEVDISVKADVAKVWIDGTQVPVDESGSGAARVAPGVHHAIAWAVRGQSGTTYSIKITAPSEAKLARSDTFDDEQFDAGIAWFTVNAARPAK
jgi:hypothetical protein